MKGNQRLRSSVHCGNKQLVLWGVGNHAKNLKARTKMWFEENKKKEMNKYYRTASGFRRTNVHTETEGWSLRVAKAGA